MKYLIIFSLLLLTACSSAHNRCNQDPSVHSGQQKSR